MQTIDSMDFTSCSAMTISKGAALNTWRVGSTTAVTSLLRTVTVSSTSPSLRAAANREAGRWKI